MTIEAHLQDKINKVISRECLADRLNYKTLFSGNCTKFGKLIGVCSHQSVDNCNIDRHCIIANHIEHVYVIVNSGIICFLNLQTLEKKIVTFLYFLLLKFRY